MDKKAAIMLVGAGGYGVKYLDMLFENMDKGALDFTGIVSSSGAKNNPRLGDIRANNIPVYASLDEFCDNATADIAIICSPIHLHLPHTRRALEAGMNVLCEKPVSAAIQYNLEMAEARDRTERFVSIGYDWSFTTAVQELKKDVISGALGKCLRAKTIVLWPRNHAYYGRNKWAGRLKDDDGTWILDSPVNNATAHYLHNMFYVLGARIDSSASPAHVEAELYRANSVENYDAAAIRAITEEGAEILFFSTHAVSRTRGPDFSFEFENASVDYRSGSGAITAKFRGGRSKSYGSPVDYSQKMPKVWNCIDAVNSGAPVMCGIEAASSHTVCMNGAQESAPGIISFPEEIVKVKKEDDKMTTFADGLFETFCECYEKNLLPNELNIKWSRKPRKIILKGYVCFPSG